VMDAVRHHFRPEFLNRLDEIILFHRLSRENMDKIVDIQIGRLATLLANRKITIDLDAKARDWLAQAGYDPVYGARPLKRVIQKRLQDPLAQLLLGGDILDGAHVKVSVGKKGLLINGHSFDADDDLMEAAPPQSRAIHYSSPAIAGGVARTKCATEGANLETRFSALFVRGQR
jgi:ATP-dependent Clp protease ATP-binding subunit ClpB